MPFSKFTAQADAIGPGGGLEVWLELYRDATPKGQEEECHILVTPRVNVESSRLVVKAKDLDAFVTALTNAIAEGRRSGVLPPAES